MTGPPDAAVDAAREAMFRAAREAEGLGDWQEVRDFETAIRDSERARAGAEFRMMHDDHGCAGQDALRDALQRIVIEWYTPGYQPHKMYEIAQGALATTGEKATHGAGY